MARLFLTFLFGIVCLAGGFAAGVWMSSKSTSIPPAKLMANTLQNVPVLEKLPWSQIAGPPDENSPFETYNYPTIKWRAKPLADNAGAIAQLWTTYERGDQQRQTGRMNYRLTLFKAPGKNACEVQLLDANGFKLMQFEASDFHAIPGAPDILESRDSHQCSEDEYKRVRDYSIK